MVVGVVVVVVVVGVVVVVEVVVVVVVVGMVVVVVGVVVVLVEDSDCAEPLRDALVTVEVEEVDEGDTAVEVVEP